MRLAVRGASSTSGAEDLCSQVLNPSACAPSAPRSSSLYFQKAA